MTIETLKSILKHYKLDPNKTYGQNFLMDETILEDMIDEAGVKSGDRVLEVGPGICNLTERLLQHGAEVVAIEKDQQFSNVLKSVAELNPKLSFEFTDILKYDLSEKFSGLPYKVVANIPYYITGKIIQKFIQSSARPISLTLLVQKEVAYNISAELGQYNLLAISVQLYGDAKVLRVVPRHKFYPEPKVDSAVVQITFPKKAKFKIDDEKKLFKILHACFIGKRKQLHNSLTNNLNLDKDFVLQVLTKLKIDPTVRPQAVSLEQWLDLAKSLEV